MAADLEAGASQVHDKARAVLRFWFEEMSADKRFAKDAMLDAEIERRFGRWHDDVLSDKARGWTRTQANVLAAIVLLDQFSRNIYRGKAEAFAGDELARSLTHMAVCMRWDRQLSKDERQFLYMPLMHSESLIDQATSIAAFATLDDAELEKFATAHHDVIERFGRFPSRNAALGRQSTPEEEEYLSQPGAGW